MAGQHEETSLAGQARACQQQMLNVVEQFSSSIQATTLPEARLALIDESAPLFVQLRGLLRHAYGNVRQEKERMTSVREKADTMTIGLQNLLYQKRHLYVDIQDCKDFQSTFQTIDLASKEEFDRDWPKANVEAEDPSENAAEALQDYSVLATASPSGLNDDPHALQLARLQFELYERRRLEREKHDLQRTRHDLLQDTHRKRKTLEVLENDLKDMLGKSTQIHKRFKEAIPTAHEGDASAEPLSQASSSAGGDEDGDRTPTGVTTPHAAAHGTSSTAPGTPDRMQL